MTNYKYLFILVILLLISACIKMPASVPKEVTTEVKYTFNGGSDMSSLFKFTAMYIGADNKEVVEEVESLPWVKKINVSIPFNSKLTIGFTKKSDLPYPDKDEYHVGFGGLITHKALTGQPPASASTQTELIQRYATILNEHGNLVFSVRLPSGTSANSVNLTIPTLKYNKHFAFSFTADDAVVGAYSIMWSRINQKWIETDPNKDFFHMGMPTNIGYIPKNTLGFTDGCGVERRFPIGVSIWPTKWDEYNPNGCMKDSDQSPFNPYITWEELVPILDFGGSVFHHNVDERKYSKTDPIAIALGFIESKNKVAQKLNNRSMKVLAEPDGNSAYFTAATQSPSLIKLFRTDRSIGMAQNHIVLKNSGSLFHKTTYAGYAEGINVAAKEIELEEQSNSSNPYWVNWTTHRITDQIGLIEKINDKYGKDGKDNIWFATLDEVYEYVEMREKAVITKSVNGDLVTFEVALPTDDSQNYKELSFLLSGVGSDCAVTPISNNIVGLSHAFQSGHMLINVNFNSETLRLAEKYTAKYETTNNESYKSDAQYFISMLTKQLGEPFKVRLKEMDNRPFVLNSIKLNNGANVSYDQNISISFDMVGTPTHYRAGESHNLSNQDWIAYQISPIKHSLSMQYGAKTVYFQVKNAVSVSEVQSASIIFSAVPGNGIIGKDGIQSYITKYHNLKFEYAKTIR